MKLQEYFNKLKLELHLLGYEADDYFEQIGGRPVNVSISGGESNLRVTFGFPGDRRSYTGITAEGLAREIYAYLKRKEAWERSSTMGKPYGEVPSAAKKSRPKVTVPKAPPAPKAKSQQAKPAGPPPRRVILAGPSTLYENAKHDWELSFQDFDDNVLVIIKTGELKRARDLRLTDLSPQHIMMIQELLKGFARLEALLASTT